MYDSPFLIETQYHKSASKEDESRGQKWIRQERELKKAMDQSLLQEVQSKLRHMRKEKKQADFYMIDIQNVDRSEVGSSQSSREKVMKKFREQQLSKKLDIFKISQKIAIEQLSYVVTPKLTPKNKRLLSQSVNMSFYCSSPQSTTTQFWKRKQTSKSKPGTTTPKTNLLRETTSTQWEGPKKVRRSSIMSSNIVDGDFRSFSSQPLIQLSTIRVDKKFTLQKLQNRYGQRIGQLFYDFLDLPQYLNYKQWQRYRRRLFDLWEDAIIAVLFRVFDTNNDRLVCSSDLFRFNLETQFVEDVNAILDFAKKRLNQEKVTKDEIMFMQKSQAMKAKVLKLSEIELWNEPYQEEPVNAKQGLNYIRIVPMMQFVAKDNYFIDEQDQINAPVRGDLYPNWYEKQKAFSLNYILFRRMWKERKECKIWNDFIQYFSGLIN